LYEGTLHLHFLCNAPFYTPAERIIISVEACNAVKDKISLNVFLSLQVVYKSQRTGSDYYVMEHYDHMLFTVDFLKVK